ncbi:MAG: pantoate--beta-alanine ligase [Phenylobacterium sp.]|uniref:pantoate--beta-alanine ligase n=1 Tax=Phenylobacterium sp. TaxID=1871053 RepID=UPI00262A64E7|nr:pantoate--beta-alanine ligase [Phenylobacterium sp.]MDB5461621.1 pantoate--beta-alanine ligase [Phenylobacterium sp.]MDB5497366.1 pantoate--beta-alanine ligase [Phenylobacterium sp.]
MQVLQTIAQMRAARPGAGDLGLVPTMGYLHAGHLSLVERAKAECGAVAVSIFVNPTQFGPGEDLSRYPRDLPRDLGMLEAAGVDLVFAPEPSEIYPPGFATEIRVGGVTDVLEGAVRPGHFAGVATVVAKLFNIVQPTRAYFGQKDAQQSVVIRKLVADLDLPVEIVVAPTVREADGLALSSRNSYLTPEQRAAAPAIFRALTAARVLFEGGERDAEAVRQAMRATIAAEPDMRIDYVSVADPETLRELSTVDRAALASMAVRLGATRLIDNLLLGGEAAGR